jgi:hypothetical protein
VTREVIGMTGTRLDAIPSVAMMEDDDIGVCNNAAGYTKNYSSVKHC